MHRFRVLMVLVPAFATPLPAQRPPAEVLSRAVILYEELQLERAVTLLKEVMSPSNTAVTGTERVQAMKYLGAAYALLGRRDSSIAYFQAALERDPFTDLDPVAFTAQERQLFGIARRHTFIVGARAVSDSGFVPGRGRVPLHFMTTRHARVQAIVRRPGAEEPVASFRWTAEGASESPWDGLDQHGERLAPGRYELRVSATSTMDSLGDTVALRFDVRYNHEPLEDTLVLDPASMLPERQPPAVARKHLAAGLGAAAFAVALPTIIGHGELRGTRTHAAVIASITASGGIAAFVLARRGAAIPSNVLANARRREEHVRLNNDIRERNAARMAEARMIVTPASGDSR